MYPRISGQVGTPYKPVIKIESPGYVTAVAEIPRDKLGQGSVYWELIDPDFSLLLLGFDARTGCLVECTVPQYKGVIAQAEGPPPWPEPIASSPAFDLSPWQDLLKRNKTGNRVVATAGRISLVQYSPWLVIGIVESPAERATISADRLVCCFSSDGSLCRIGLRGDSVGWEALYKGTLRESRIVGPN